MTISQPQITWLQNNLVVKIVFLHVSVAILYISRHIKYTIIMKQNTLCNKIFDFGSSRLPCSMSSKNFPCHEQNKKTLARRKKSDRTLWCLFLAPTCCCCVSVTPVIVLLLILTPLVQINDAKSCDILFPKEDGLTIVQTINHGSDLINFLSGKDGTRYVILIMKLHK